MGTATRRQGSDKVGRDATKGVSRLARTAEDRGIRELPLPLPTRSQPVADPVFVLATTVAFFALVALVARGAARL
jgi:hypothetical protein